MGIQSVQGQAFRSFNAKEGVLENQDKALGLSNKTDEFGERKLAERGMVLNGGEIKLSDKQQKDVQETVSKIASEANYDLPKIQAKVDAGIKVVDLSETVAFTVKSADAKTGNVEVDFASA